MSASISPAQSIRLRSLDGIGTITILGAVMEGPAKPMIVVTEQREVSIDWSVIEEVVSEASDRNGYVMQIACLAIAIRDGTWKPL